MPNYCSVNFLKIHRADVKPLQDEKNREAEKYKNRVDLTKDNDYLRFSNDWNRDITAICDGRGIKERKNAVVAVNACFRASADALKVMKPEVKANYWKDCKDWIESKGWIVISSIIHKDEDTEHLECTFVPVGKHEYKSGVKDVLSAKKYFGTKVKLANLQTEFAEKVGKNYGLKRGQERVGTGKIKKALSDLEYQKVKVQEKIENKNNELSEVLDDLKVLDLREKKLEKELKFLKRLAKMQKLNPFQRKRLKKLEGLKQDYKQYESKLFDLKSDYLALPKELPKNEIELEKIECKIKNIIFQAEQLE